LKIANVVQIDHSLIYSVYYRDPVITRKEAKYSLFNIVDYKRIKFLVFTGNKPNKWGYRQCNLLAIVIDLLNHTFNNNIKSMMTVDLQTERLLQIPEKDVIIKHLCHYRRALCAMNCASEFASAFCGAK